MLDHSTMLAQRAKLRLRRGLQRLEAMVDGPERRRVMCDADAVKANTACGETDIGYWLP